MLSARCLRATRHGRARILHGGYLRQQSSSSSAQPLVFTFVDERVRTVGRGIPGPTTAAQQPATLASPQWRVLPDQSGGLVEPAVADALLEAHAEAMREQAASAAEELGRAREYGVQLEQRIAQLEAEAATAELARTKSEAKPDPAQPDTQPDTALQPQLQRAHDMLRNAVLDKAFVSTPAVQLLQLPADALLGVGGKTAAALSGAGIHTIADLATWDLLQVARAVAPETPAAELCSQDEDGQDLLVALRLKTAEDVTTWKAAEFAEAVAMVAEGAPSVNV
jgi:hypothetical protein